MFPLSSDAYIFGLLCVILAGIFYASNHPKTKGIFTFIPALLLCYFIPAACTSLGIIDPDWISSEMLLYGGEYYKSEDLTGDLTHIKEAGKSSSLYYVASRFLLPASLVLLCLSIDIKGFSTWALKP